MRAFIMAWNVVRGLGDVFVNGAGNAGMKRGVKCVFWRRVCGEYLRAGLNQSCLMTRYSLRCRDNHMK
ncbi:hypothetical protein [Bartonella sp. AP60NXGY]|uniref:hypothetical protein n=1 Tax=Bartonella sp. AP60NXGY TaxID=3243499 RepID=UPI0035CEA02F